MCIYLKTPQTNHTMRINLHHKITKKLIKYIYLTNNVNKSFNKKIPYVQIIK